MNATTAERRIENGIDIDAAVRGAREQILADIIAGIVPLEVRCMSDVPDRGANWDGYGYSQFVEQVGDQAAKEATALLELVWRDLSDWLGVGGHFEALRERGVRFNASYTDWLRELAALLRIQRRVGI